MQITRPNKSEELESDAVYDALIIAVELEKITSPFDGDWMLSEGSGLGVGGKVEGEGIVGGFVSQWEKALVKW